ncbi:hypothetical protein ACSBR1_023936 [Camellia fascicularis]
MSLMGLRIWRHILANRDIHEGRSESGGLIGPKVSFTDGASNSETYILAKRDIHEGRSESGGLIGPKVSCTDGAPNSETYLGQS